MTVFEKNNIISEARYAMYLRKSRADLELEAISKEETLARHKAMLFALAERHNILPSQIDIYHEVVSGESLDDRPEALRLLKDVYNKKYKAVLVVEIERLARGNTKDQGEVADAFTFSGTHIITPAKVYDPNNEFDQEYFEFGLFMSRREFKTIRRRLEAGKDQSVREGNYLPPIPPFGFNIVRTSKKDRYLVEKPEESKYVKMIFDWYTEDRKPTAWIARQLTLMGVKTPKKNKEWQRSSIREILLNLHYIGKVTWGVQKTIKVKDHETGKVKKKVVKTGEMKVYEGKHDGFISVEQFNKAQAIYGSNAPSKINTELTNPLSGILVCARCGAAIRHINYNTGGTASRYHHAYGIHACKMKSMAAPVVVDSLISALKGYIEDFQIKLDSGNVNHEAERQMEVIAAMESELAKQQRMKRKLFDSWESDDGTYTKDEFLERKAMYNSTIERLEAQISELRKSTPAPINYEEKISNLHAVIDCLNNPDMDATAKNIFLKQFIDRVEFDTIDLGLNKGAEAVMDVFLK